VGNTHDHWASTEGDDPDTIGVEPRGTRKCRRQDSGVHLDDGFGGLPAQTVDFPGQTCATSENELEQRPHLEFMADIVGVYHKSKLPVLGKFSIQSSGAVSVNTSSKITLPSCGGIHMRVVSRSRTSWRLAKMSSDYLTDATSARIFVITVSRFRDWSKSVLM
jgi:hypothetical protein